MTDSHFLSQSESDSFESDIGIRRLVSQIEKMAVFLQKQPSAAIYEKKSNDIKSLVNQVIKEFYQEEATLLEKFDLSILPLAKEVLALMLSEAEQARITLHALLDHESKRKKPSDWNVEADRWQKIYAKWHDRKAIASMILEKVEARTKYLIDKDIQMIVDYQQQSISHLGLEKENFQKIKKKLTNAIQEPMRELVDLTKHPKNYTSVQEASRWIAELDEVRESYFDQLLMKIDNVMKELVKHELEEKDDSDLFIDVSSELIFIENELTQIDQEMQNIPSFLEEDKRFYLERLESMLDHLHEWNQKTFPNRIKKRIDALLESVSHSLLFLKEKK
jgi:hypothetical protein